MSDGWNAKSDQGSSSRSRSTSVGSSVETLGSNVESETRVGFRCCGCHTHAADDIVIDTPPLQMRSFFMTAPGEVAGLPESEFASPSPFVFSGPSLSQSFSSGISSFIDEPEKNPGAAADFFTRVRLPSRRKAATVCQMCKPVRKCHLKGCGSRCVCDHGAPGEKKRQQKLKLLSLSTPCSHSCCQLDVANISAAFGPVNTMQPLMYSGN